MYYGNNNCSSFGICKSGNNPNMYSGFNIGCNCKCPSATAATNGTPSSSLLSSSLIAPSSLSSSMIKTLTCYTPKQVKNIGSVSCVLDKSVETPALITVDENLAIIPSNAVIDFIEYYGMNNFSVKETFDIGLGQLNSRPLVQLIQEGTVDIANERCGGRRYFVSIEPDGRNDNVVVLYPSYVNVSINSPITSGALSIVIGYHLKPTTG